MTAYLKTILAVVGLFLLNVAQAQEQDRDSDGFFKNPVCENTRMYTRKLSNLSGIVPLDIKASNVQWDMELYGNKSTNSWSLVAQSRDGSVPTFKSCELDRGIGDPTKRPWFPVYFKNYAVVKP